MRRHWVFRLPIVRGVVALGESLAIGFRALSISANYALGDIAEVRRRTRTKARKQVVKLLEAGEPVRVRVKTEASRSSTGWRATSAPELATVEQAPPRSARPHDVLAPAAEREGNVRRRRRIRPSWGRWTLVFSFVVAIGFVVGVFKVGPALLTDAAPDQERHLVRAHRGSASGCSLFLST